MAYISLPDSNPGILGLLSTYPETGQILLALTQQILRGRSSLSSAERELIAASVSRANECMFCAQAHASAACNLLPKDQVSIVEEVITKQNLSVLSEKMQAFIELALAVQKGGQFVDQSHIDRVREVGADDKTIHDIVLIAAAFCMFNRYVDGLGTWTPENADIYKSIGQKITTDDYLSVPTLPD
ncbi:carboxymuconolactone decarboxylase family protein [Calothrix sp. CCY 0018]|uniref:carboxymuconolactone decarboxylase family protein n=1 Tax=Calothrix sp. CCY 0018 TaxID=3103864 RepID=UPI0039C6288C